MATLIAVYTSEGCVGRCDAKCYDAVEPRCDCVCGGANHGAGLGQAAANTRAHAEAWLRDAQARGWAFDHAELGQAAAPTLF